MCLGLLVQNIISLGKLEQMCQMIKSNIVKRKKSNPIPLLEMFYAFPSG